MVDPQTCTLFVLKQTVPYSVYDGDDDADNYDDADKPELSFLKSIFGKIYTTTNLDLCVNYIHQQPTTALLLLVELDGNETSTKEQTTYISAIAGKCPFVPVIVYANNDDPSFMFDCIQAGAIHYIIKPLTPDIAKTLFLTLYQNQKYRQPPSNATLYQDNQHLVSSSTISTVEEDEDPAVISPLTPTTFPASVHHPPTSCTIAQQSHQHSFSVITNRFSVPVIGNDRNLKKSAKEDQSNSIHHKLEAINTFSTSLIDQFIPPNLSLPTYEPLKIQHRIKLQSLLSSWNFDPFQLTLEELVHCAVLMLRNGVPKISQRYFSEEQLYNFVIELSMSYHDENSYHNFAHAVDVLQCMYFFLQQLDLTASLSSRNANIAQQHSSSPVSSQFDYSTLLRPLDIFALLVAALGHDSSHPGVNNGFLIDTSAPLSYLYNDQSVLEHFHAMTLSQLLLKHGFQRILTTMDLKDSHNSHNNKKYDCYKEFRNVIITTILATDMALHHDYLEKINTSPLFHSLMPRTKERDDSLLIQEQHQDITEKGRLLFCCTLMKCADISNVARPFATACKWAEILMEEFATQGDLEKAVGMNLSLPTMMDRSVMVLEDAQLGFIRFVALGLFETVSRFIRELSFTVEHINENISVWEERKIRNNGQEIQPITIPQQVQTEDDCSYDSNQRNRADASTITTSSINSERSRTPTTTVNQHSEAATTKIFTTVADKDYRKLPEMPATVSPMSHIPDTTTTTTTINMNRTNDRYPNCMDDFGDNDLSNPGMGPSPVYCQCIVQ
ncbi:hypothetical protein BDF20DRAFT_998486 [Mycotypha africana]|uniref:uncharacterized protein n=1 Tax=Mycotypha africana TaxID=64632 RepID=UPI002300AEE1|nr:uncharacterized protein BDF20DRAFT_998486 [Mycotypha africana]KAI8987944.1 hypothetical protein BDF20DRAFT_998486 [Mycotypha africana]